MAGVQSGFIVETKVFLKCDKFKIFFENAPYI